MMAQLVATNGCLWIALVGIEAKAEAEHSADEMVSLLIADPEVYCRKGIMNITCIPC